MTGRFVAMPRKHADASRLAWTVAKAIVSRKKGWSLGSLHVSRRWRFQVARARWTALAQLSFFFEEGGPLGAVYAIYFEGTGAAAALDSSPLVQDLRNRLDTYASFRGNELVRKLMETRPGPLLAEMDRIAQAFGADDRHRAPASRSHVVGKRLATIAETVLRRGTWNLETPSVVLWRDRSFRGAISPMPSYDSGRPQLATHLFVDDGKTLSAAIGAHATSRGYRDQAGEGSGDLALTKLQPLSRHAALTEARFLEQIAR